MPAEKQLVEVLTGALSEPPIILSEMAEHDERLTRDERRMMSEMQMRKWRLPLVRAVRNIIAVVGDKSIVDFSRSDAIAFRDWWYGKIEEGETHSPSTSGCRFRRTGPARPSPAR